MKITIIAIGSRGDIVPHVALGQGLIKAGHTVRLATHQAFKELVCRYSIPFFPIDDEAKEFFQVKGGEQILDQGTDPSRFSQQIALRIAEATPLYMQRSIEACREADLIIVAFASILIGHAIAEKYQKKLVISMLQPMLLSTTAFPEPNSRWLLQGSLPFRKTLNQRSHSKTQQAFGQMFLPAANEARQSLLNLSPLPDTFYTNLPGVAELILCGYSSLLIPRPTDWSEKLSVTGYWTLKHEETWQPESELVDFLHVGSKPIYIGFGSMSSYHPTETIEIVEEALRKIKQRGIMLVDPGVYSQQKSSEWLYFMTETAHDWLFPRMKAVVHHGGAGTTSASLHAGVPTIVFPSIADQWFWGHHVARIGAGPRPINRKQLTADKLAERLDAALHNLEMRQRAREIGTRLRSEKGIDEAIKAIEALEAKDYAPILPGGRISHDTIQ